MKRALIITIVMITLSLLGTAPLPGHPVTHFSQSSFLSTNPYSYFLSQNSPLFSARRLLSLYKSPVNIKSSEQTPIVLRGDFLYPATAVEAPASAATLGAAPGFTQTSEFMLGKVAIGIILPESNGSIDPSTENWDADRINFVVSKIQDATRLWTEATAGSTLSFYYDVQAPVATQYEPIRRSSQEDKLWISEIFSILGYSGSTWLDQTYSYLNALRSRYGTDWAVVVFVADSLNDGDGAFSDSRFAYTDGSLVVMTYKNGDWGTSQMNAVMAHELGHVFGAANEDCQPGFDCCTGGGQHGYLGVPNTNCEAGCDKNGNGICDGDDVTPQSNCHNCSGCPNVYCIMSNYVPTIDQPSRQQVGIRDSDGDQIYDPLDTFPEISFDPTSFETITSSVATFTGKVDDIPFPSPNRPSVTINFITDAQFQIDRDGLWRPASAADGAFNQTHEEVSLSTPPLADGMHSIAMRARNRAGNFSPVITDTFRIDATGPLGSLAIESGRSATTSHNVILTITASDAGSAVMHMRLSADGISWNIWEAFAAQKDWLLSPADGVKTVYIQFEDQNGNLSQVFQSSILVDTIQPAGSLSINGSSLYSPSTSVNIILSANDIGSGVDQMRFSEGGVNWNAWEPYLPAKPWSLSPGEGIKIVCVQYLDAAGNLSNTSCASIILDTVSPNGTLSINNGSPFTSSWPVDLSLIASDSGSGVTEMRFSIDGLVWTSWEPYADQYEWTLQPQEGLQKIYTQFKDQAGNISPNITGSIYLDQTAPSGAFSINEGALYTAATLVRLLLSADDSASGVVKMRFSSTSADWTAWEGFLQEKNWILSEGDGQKAIYVQFMDGAGNLSLPVTGNILLDTTPPSGSLVIGNGSGYVSSTAASLAIFATDSGAGIAEIRLANQDSPWSKWIPYSSQLPWNLYSLTGTQTIYAQLKDYAGNLSKNFRASVIPDVEPPMANISSPDITSEASFWVSWSGSDALSGVASYDVQFQVDSRADWYEWLHDESETSALFGPEIPGFASPLQPGHSYTFRVRARDRAGNQSAYPDNGQTHTHYLLGLYLPVVFMP